MHDCKLETETREILENNYGGNNGKMWIQTGEEDGFLFNHSTVPPLVKGFNQMESQI